MLVASIKRNFLVLKASSLIHEIFVTTPVQREQPEIMSVYDLLVFVLTVM